ncbi:DMT family transporter [Phaeovulum sp. W22_SRMD_FR3]|uniref:DMT family transporter n=1 Tax=Phaeovulum sp. W22_SRMD_FR3 TaxID=3240274 RepID=UPI003F9E77ED
MSQAFRGHLAMLTFSALVAGSFSLGALTAPLITPTALNTMRFALAAGLVIGLALFQMRAARAQGEAEPRPGRADPFRAPWRYAILGLLYALYFVLMFEALKTAAPVSVSAVFTLTPLIAAGFGYLLLRQRMTARIALALTLGAGGALWVIFRGDMAALLRFDLGRGEAIYFLGCVGHALYTPLVRKLNRGEPAPVFTSGILTAATILLGLWSLRDIAATDWAALPAVVWITIVYTAVFATAASAMILQYASQRLPSAKVMAYTYLTPVWVILWQTALGQSGPGWIILPGLGATLVALALLLRD